MKRLVLAVALASQCFGAANMVLTGLTVDVNGAYVATFSPCASPLSLSSGAVVTGATPYNNGFAARTVQSSSISGCTLTMAINANTTATLPVFADDPSPVYLSIATSSNLQDAGGNTVSASATNTNFPSTANNSTWYQIAGAAGGTHIRVHGAPAIGTSAPGSVQWISSDGCFRFSSTWTGSSGGFNVYTFNYLTGFIVFEDGIQIGGQTSTTSDAEYSSYPVGGSLSGTHTYEVCENLIGNSDYIMYGLQLVNGSFGAKPAAKKLMFVYGASEAACQGLSDTTGCAWWIIARQLGYSDQKLGNAGWPVTTNTACYPSNCRVITAGFFQVGAPYVILTTGSTNFVAIGAANNNPGTIFTATGAGSGSGTVGILYTTTSLALCAKNPGGLCGSAWANYNLSVAPDMVIFTNGGNDTIDGTTIGSGYATPGTFGGDAVSLFGNVVSTLSASGAQLFVMEEYYAPGIGGAPCPASASQLPEETAWLGAGNYFAAANPSYKVHVNSTFAATCGFGSGDFQGDNLHLNPTGQAAWANVMLPYLVGFFANPSVYGIAIQ
jgi:lysophospholipase L1-like esterase